MTDPPPITQVDGAGSGTGSPLDPVSPRETWDTLGSQAATPDRRLSRSCRELRLIRLPSFGAGSIWGDENGSPPGHPTTRKAPYEMTSPETEPVGDPYPASWRPKEAPPFESDFEAPTVEAFLASLSTEEFILLCNRARGGNR